MLQATAEQKGRKKIARLYRKGEKFLAELRTVQEERQAYENETIYKRIELLSIMRANEHAIKCLLCEINAKLAQVSNKYGCYCEFYEEALS